MTRLISILPAEECFPINWRINTRCNYDCMYCPTNWHDNHSSHHSLEDLKKAWKSLYQQTSATGLKYKISFTGGEVTTNRSFLPFVQWLRDCHQSKIHKILVTTNGSASYTYYQRMFDSVDNISFSVHSEHINESDFFDKIIKLKNNLKPNRFLQVQIMDEFWNRSRIPMYTKILNDNDISYNVNQIDLSLQTRSVPIFKGRLDLEV